MPTLTRADALAVAELLAAAGRDEIMPRFRGAQAFETRQKTSAFDVVTDADEAAERAISRGLRARYGGATIIGEEASGRDPALLSRIAGDALCFVVDPIDGTKNFSSGLPLFGSMVAATVGGDVVLAAIHDPVCGDTFLAVRGDGAWRLDADGRTHDLRVAKPVPVDQMHAVAGTNFLPSDLRAIVTGNLARLGLSFWMRCAAHEYRLAAAGHLHILMYNKLMPWDHAAGWLLHREAGGYSAHFDGTAYAPSHFTGGLICAPDRASWNAVRAALFTPSSC